MKLNSFVEAPDTRSEKQVAQRQKDQDTGRHDEQTPYDWIT